MTRQVAFLRAINVGGHVVKMDRLRALFEELGLKGVETFIASGNVMFDGTRGARPALERRVERHLGEALGYEVATFIRDAPDLARILALDPFGADGAPPPALYVGLMAKEPAREASARLVGMRSDTDVFQVTGAEVYWGCRTRVSDSTFSGAVLERTLGTPVTVRGINTIRRLSARMPA